MDSLMLSVLEEIAIYKNGIFLKDLWINIKIDDINVLIFIWKYLLQTPNIKIINVTDRNAVVGFEDYNPTNIKIIAHEQLQYASLGLYDKAISVSEPQLNILRDVAKTKEKGLLQCDIARTGADARSTFHHIRHLNVYHVLQKKPVVERYTNLLFLNKWARFSGMGLNNNPSIFAFSNHVDSRTIFGETDEDSNSLSRIDHVCSMICDFLSSMPRGYCSEIQLQNVFNLADHRWNHLKKILLARGFISIEKMQVDSTALENGFENEVEIDSSTGEKIDVPSSSSFSSSFSSSSSSSISSFPSLPVTHSRLLIDVVVLLRPYERVRMQPTIVLEIPLLYQLYLTIANTGVRGIRQSELVQMCQNPKKAVITAITQLQTNFDVVAIRENAGKQSVLRLFVRDAFVMRGEGGRGGSGEGDGGIGEGEGGFA